MYIDRELKRSLVDKYKDEQVFVVPYDTVAHIKDKFTPSNHKENKLAIEKLNIYDTLGRYILRHDAEYNPTFQQLIPYVLIMDPSKKRFFISERIAGDQRLLKDFSLGFGGHINPCDGSNGVIMKSLYRELQEEVKIEKYDNNASFVGYVRDLSSSTPDHIGFVFVVEASNVSIKEDDNLVGQWMTIKDLENNYFRFESWAKHIIDYLYINKNNL